MWLHLWGLGHPYIDQYRIGCSPSRYNMLKTKVTRLNNLNFVMVINMHALSPSRMRSSFPRTVLHIYNRCSDLLLAPTATYSESALKAVDVHWVLSITFWNSYWRVRMGESHKRDPDLGICKKERAFSDAWTRKKIGLRQKVLEYLAPYWSFLQVSHAFLLRQSCHGFNRTMLCNIEETYHSVIAVNQQEVALPIHMHPQNLCCLRDL